MMQSLFLLLKYQLKLHKSSWKLLFPSFIKKATQTNVLYNLTKALKNIQTVLSKESDFFQLFKFLLLDH